MSHQDGLGNDRTEPTGLTKPDGDNDRVQKKSENIAHDRRYQTERSQEFRTLAEFAYHRLAGSFKSGKSADCIIATNAGPHSW
jgi:hypothetical protein